MDKLFHQPHLLDYTIHSCSNCSTTYHPFTILEDAPTEPSSRWSGSGPPHPSSRPNDSQKPPASNLEPKVRCVSPDRALDSQLNPLCSTQSPKKKDYIIIDLGKPCIVRSITFGKFHRPHPCNVKLFRIWGSLAPGEGQGDFRALLASQPIENHTLRTNLPHQSVAFKYPSQSSLQQNHLSKKFPSNSNTTTDLDDHSNHLLKSHPQPFSSLSIRARGERHTGGPRMELLAQGELKNDTIPETVPLRWKNSRVPWFKSPNNLSDLDHTSFSASFHAGSRLSYQTVIVPIRYIKIEPLSAAGSNYNCSIWHISVKGHDEDHILRPCLENYEQWRASAALRLCLKHLRQTGHYEAFQALLKSAAHPSQSPLLVPPSSDFRVDPTSNRADLPDQPEGNLAMFGNSILSHSAQFNFEHSLVSALHSALVSKSQALSEFDQPLGSTSSNSNRIPPRLSPIGKAEQIVIHAASEGLFDQWARAEPPTLACDQIRQRSLIPSDLPCPRGGHQMCIDSKRRKIWLFGGFDGYEDLGDLWVYHLEPCDPSAQEEEASLPYTVRNDPKPTEPVDPGFLRTGRLNTGVLYNRWQRISHDVKQEDGPIKRSCHKMVLDETTGDLYVMGRYIERSRIDRDIQRSRKENNQPSDLLESSINSNFPINPNRLSVQTVRIPNNLVDPENNAQGEPAAPTPELIDNMSLDEANVPTPYPEIAVDELMGNDETIFQPPEIPPSPSGHLKNDFFRFRPFEDPSSDKFLEKNGRIGRWECLSQDTYVENGPRLIFDHQMVLDSERRKIYVFGGKIIQPIFIPSQDPSGSSSRPNLIQYSGLFEYDLTANTWVQLMTDPGTAGSNSQNPISRVLIPSRMGHSLILDKKRGCLWILTGERDNHYYSDIWRYDIEEQRAELIIGDYTCGGRHRQSSDVDGNQYGSAPEAGFSQRITFDPELDEWHMFCGLCRDRGAAGTEVSSTKVNLKSQMMSSEFWRWRIDEGKWTQVIMKNQFDGMQTPPPRFAHQMVFDTLTKTHYVFGGNPADNDNEPTRLGDFWRLKLIQPTRGEALRRCLFGLRRQHFIEMCQEGTNTAGALWYLQNDLSSVTNHLDDKEGRLFRACTSYLLAGPGPRFPLIGGKEEGEEEEEEEEDREGDFNLEEEQEPEQEMMRDGEPEQESDRRFRNQKIPSVDEVIDHHHIPQDMKILINQRVRVFQDLLAFFPDSMTEPEESLIDLIDTWGDRETFW